MLSSSNSCGYFLIFKKYLFIYLFLAILGFRCFPGFSVVVARGASLELQYAGSMGFTSCSSLGWSTGSILVVHGLSCSAACGIFPGQGSNLCLLH